MGSGQSKWVEEGLWRIHNKMSFKDRPRIYIMGMLNADHIHKVLRNMRLGMRTGTELLLAGYAPFVPFFDFHFFLMLREQENISEQEIYEYGLAYLKISDGGLLLPNWTESPGANLEKEKADEWKIPTCTSIDEVKKRFPLS